MSSHDSFATHADRKQATVLLLILHDAAVQDASDCSVNQPLIDIVTSSSRQSDHAMDVIEAPSPAEQDHNAPATPQPEGWVATMSRPCGVCGQPIQIGTRIWPLTDCPDTLAEKFCIERTAWAEIRCLRAAMPDLELVPPICKYFARLGRCAYGNACRYRHDAAAARALPVRRMRMGSSSGERLGRRIVSNSAKSAVFRRWLIDTFGRSALLFALDCCTSPFEFLCRIHAATCS